LIIGTLAGAKVFSLDNFDTLITKAALHGSKLLKKSHQATAVGLASHLWWQEAVTLVTSGKEEEEMEGSVEGQLAKSKVVERLQQLAAASEKDGEEVGVKAVSFRHYTALIS
jgi:hypothetical protein